MPGRPLSYLAAVPVDLVKNVGTARSKMLAKAGIRSVAELLLHVPRRYIDRSQLFDIGAVPLEEEVTVAGTVMSVKENRYGKKKKRTIIRITDGTSSLWATIWNPYIRVREGEQIALSGTIEMVQGRLHMKSPDLDHLEEMEDQLTTGRVVPVHPAVGKINAHGMRKAIANALTRSQPIDEILPEDVLDQLDLMDRSTAFDQIHFPDELAHVAAARRRLVFDELFRLEIALALRKHTQRDEATGIAHSKDGDLVAGFLGALPYDLTPAQRRAVAEIQHDMVNPHPMHRLLQGEVGSGKTVVAVAGLLTAVQSGYQGAVMAPTEVLAEQHYLGMTDLIAAAGMQPSQWAAGSTRIQDSLFDAPTHRGDTDADSDVGDTAERAMATMALLTGSNAAVNFDEDASRGDVVGWIGDGTVDLVVGTHALIQEGLHFHRLGMAVVDEQHRFGVFQRVELREKASDYDPDLLIMTATPIPRTMSMTLYGDLDVSVLDEMPPGRSPVRTRHVVGDSRDLDRVYDLIRREVAAGRQAFVVCPLVEDSDKLEVASATAEHARLQGVLSELRLGLLHGQLRSTEKEEVMSAFRNGEIDVLVATTVIEVGIDVPNATVMVIEDADRFGLSQLHQLRGRVGRGRHPATCILIADPSTVDGRARIAAMVASNDGFELAEEDLRIRGQGTVFGTRQAGLKDLRLADVLRDRELLAAARREAFDLVERDPDLEDHMEIRTEVEAFLGEDADWLLRS